MSRADSQALCLLSACEAGLLTMQAKGIGDTTLTTAVAAALADINAAYAAWPSKDKKSARRAYGWLVQWVESQDKDDTYPAHRAMIAASQQAVADLHGKLNNNRKKKAIEPLFPALAAVEDWFSRERMAWDHYDAADKILQDLYTIMRFAP